MRGKTRPFNQEKTAESVQAAFDQASTFAQSIIEQAASRAADGAQRARETGSSVGARASDRIDQASKAFEREVAPSVKDVAFQAATVALELWQAARDKAEAAIESGMSVAPEAASHALEAAERRVEAASHALEVAEKRVEDVGEMAKSASKHAASATADAGKESGSALLWAGAAAGLILFGILQKQRRDQVLRIAESALGVARDLIVDYRGQDGSFDAAAS